MKPFKSGALLAAWLLRLTLVWFVYEHYLRSFSGFDLKSFTFYMHALYLAFALLLVIGGLIRKPALSVFSGLALFILPVVQVIHTLPHDMSKILMTYLIPLAIGFYFFTNGNGQ